LLGDCCAGEEGQGGRKPGGLENPIAEEIEVNRCAVSEMQGKGRSVIEHEFAWHSDEFVPQPALRGGKYAQAWLEVRDLFCFTKSKSILSAHLKIYPDSLRRRKNWLPNSEKSIRLGA